MSSRLSHIGCSSNILPSYTAYLIWAAEQRRPSPSKFLPVNLNQPYVRCPLFHSVGPIIPFVLFCFSKPSQPWSHFLWPLMK